MSCSSQYRSDVNRLRSLARRYWFDAVIVAGIGVGLGQAVVQHKSGTRDSLWFEVPIVLAIATPLFLRRRFPFGASLAVGTAIVVSSFVDHTVVYDLAPALAGVAAVFLVGMSPERSLALAGLALSFGVVSVAVHNDPGGGIDDVASICLGLTPFWLLGLALRRKHEEAELAVVDERARIARELHDVVGHGVSVMTVQAAAVRRLLRPDQEREREALLAVERTGREALAEMRRMVGILRRADEAGALAPQPSLEHVGKLVEQAREAGLPVDLRVEGDAVPLPAGVDLTAYRLVQEGLTNALKHARATRAEVLVLYGERHVEVAVTDDGRGNGSGASGGQGLLGIRERVAVYGGELQVGARPAGGFRLRARLPVPSA